MAYKFYSGPQGRVTVTSRIEDHVEITVARIENRDLKGRWIMQVVDQFGGEDKAEIDVTLIIHDHDALTALIDKQRQS